MNNDKPRPDYRRILRALRFEEPDRLPTMELMVDLPVQSQFLGRPVKTMDDEIEFYVRAGYDYFYQKACYEFPCIPPVLSFGTQIRTDAQKTGTDISFDMHGEQPLKDRDCFGGKSAWQPTRGRWLPYSGGPVFPLRGLGSEPATCYKISMLAGTVNLPVASWRRVGSRFPPAERRC